MPTWKVWNDRYIYIHTHTHMHIICVHKWIEKILSWDHWSGPLWHACGTDRCSYLLSPLRIGWCNTADVAASLERHQNGWLCDGTLVVLHCLAKAMLILWFVLPLSLARKISVMLIQLVLGMHSNKIFCTYSIIFSEDEEKHSFVFTPSPAPKLSLQHVDK